MLSCLPCGQADPVDRAIKEAENLRNRDRQRINREIEKGDIRFQNYFLSIYNYIDNAIH